MTLEKKLNILFLFIAFLTVVVTILEHTTNIESLTILRTALEASLIGAIADSYAVYGLFRRIGPHTDILRRRRKEITEKVIEFVSDFLLNEEFLKKELENVDFSFVWDELDKPEVKNKIKEILLNLVKKYKEDRNLDRILQEQTGTSSGFILEIVKKTLEEVIFLYLETSLPEWIDKTLKKLKEDETLKEQLNREIREFLINFIETRKHLIVDLIRKRLESIDDDEFVEAVKKASWDELQWIRLNGALLGFIIGFLVGVIDWFLTS
jgi:uncharacterized membrane-anchored protein YjiN (DUF445 family)